MQLKIALAQFRPSKGDLDASFERIAECFGRLRTESRTADDRLPDLVVFPETAATGYFLEGGVREHALTVDEMLDRLGEAWRRARGVPDGAGAADGRAPPDTHDRLDVAIGFYERHGSGLYNSA
ncbi:MAG: hypothetical protein ACODAA_08285, partial [Gemmatimonadota bacterium]